MTTEAKGKHTAGPWHNDNSRKYYNKHVIRRNGVIVASMFDTTTFPQDEGNEREANARLIAQAPTFAELAQRIITYACTNRQRQYDTAALERLADDARAVLKAAGL